MVVLDAQNRGTSHIRCECRLDPVQVTLGQYKETEKSPEKCGNLHPSVLVCISSPS